MLHSTAMRMETIHASNHAEGRGMLWDRAGLLCPQPSANKSFSGRARQSLRAAGLKPLWDQAVLPPDSSSVPH